MENVLGNRILLFPSHCGCTWETFTSVCLSQQFYVFYLRNFPQYCMHNYNICMLWKKSAKVNLQNLFAFQCLSRGRIEVLAPNPRLHNVVLQSNIFRTWPQVTFLNMWERNGGGLFTMLFRASSESEGVATMSMGSWFSGMRERSVCLIIQHISSQRLPLLSPESSFE